MSLHYSKDHEWVRLEGDTATIGISHYAQDHLGDVVYVELPDVGRVLKQGEAAAVVESVKAASDVYAPIGGEVIAVNDALGDAPGDVNAEPEGRGWFFRLRPAAPSEVEALMTPAAYKEFLSTIDSSGM